MPEGQRAGVNESQVRDHVVVHLGLNVSSSAHNCGCVVGSGHLSIIIIKM